MAMMKRRNGEVIDKMDGQDRVLKVLYGSTLGRMLLRPLVSPPTR